MRLIYHKAIYDWRCLVFRKKDLYLIITQKLTFVEIRRISSEIQQISGEIQQISGEIHPKPYKIRCFNKNSSVWGVHGGGYDPGFHEIQGHSPSPAFIKLNSFGWNICFYKLLGGFHADFMWNRKTHLQGIVTLCLWSLCMMFVGFMRFTVIIVLTVTNPQY